MTHFFNPLEQSCHRQSLPFGVLPRSSVLLFFVAAFLLAPKIDVIGVLRVEDFVFLMVLPILAWRYTPRRTVIPRVLTWYFAYLGIAFLSALVNYANLGLFGLFNVARQLQYLVWFLVGAQMAAAIPEDKFERTLSIIAGLLILWWFAEASGAVPKIGKFTGASGRVTLNTSGPYEISVVVVFLMLFVRKKILLLGLFGILLATQARITLVAALAAYMTFNPRHALIYGLPACGLAVLFILINPELILNSRLAETMLPAEMWSAFVDQIRAAPVIYDLSEYRHFAYDTLWDQVGRSNDVSFEIRIIRWALILKSLSADFLHTLIGWGPGAWGAAVDSHAVRYIGEVGLIGFSLVAAFMGVSVWSAAVPIEFRLATVVLIVCSLFIDVMTSSKIMSFFWVILGYGYARSRLSR